MIARLAVVFGIVVSLAAGVVVVSRIGCGAACILREDRPHYLVESGLGGEIDRYQVHTGRLPRTLFDLVNRPGDPDDAQKWEGPYIKPDGLNDPYGVRWRYKAPGQHNPQGYDLSSAGRDKRWGTADDVVNWTTP